MRSFDGETAIITQQIADLDIDLIHHGIFPVRDLQYSRSAF